MTYQRQVHLYLLSVATHSFFFSLYVLGRRLGFGCSIPFRYFIVKYIHRIVLPTYSLFKPLAMCTAWRIVGVV
jgi:hypothetical protein